MDLSVTKSDFNLSVKSLDPYVKGGWLKIEHPVSQSFAASNFNEEEGTFILRGPTWGYEERKLNSQGCCSDFLFGKPTKIIVTQEDKILKGEKWVPTKPISTSFSQYILQKLRKLDPEAVALVEIETGRTLTYKEVQVQMKSLASGLRWIGVSPGQVIAVLSYNSMEAMIMILASVLIGSIPAIMDPSLNPYEIGALLRNVCPRVIFTESGSTLQKVETAMGYLMTGRPPTVVINSSKKSQSNIRTTYFTFSQLLVEIEQNFKPEHLHANPVNPLLILFTSGTTGTSKGALIPERFFMNSKMFVESVFHENMHSYTTLLTAPLMWVSIITNFFIHITRGHQVAFFRGSASEVVLLKALNKYKVRLWFTGPSTILSLLDWPVRPRCDFLKRVLVSGIPFSLKNALRVRDLFGGKVILCQLYDLTETGVLCGNSPVFNKFGSVGKVFYNTQLKVIDVESGLALGPCEKGELCFKSNSMFLTYYHNDQEAYNSRFDVEGFFHTGDLGFYDEEGFVFVTSRIKDSIKWKSYQEDCPTTTKIEVEHISSKNSLAQQ